MTTAHKLGIHVQRHPLYKKFRDAGLRISEVTQFVGFSNSYVSHVLMGYKPAPEKMEAKFVELARRIDELESAEAE